MGQSQSTVELVVVRPIMAKPEWVGSYGSVACVPSLEPLLHVWYPLRPRNETCEGVWARCGCLVKSLPHDLFAEQVATLQIFFSITDWVSTMKYFTHLYSPVTIANCSVNNAIWRSCFRLVNAHNVQGVIPSIVVDGRYGTTRHQYNRELAMRGNGGDYGHQQ